MTGITGRNDIYKGAKPLVPPGARCFIHLERGETGCSNLIDRFMEYFVSVKGASLARVIRSPAGGNSVSFTSIPNCWSSLEYPADTKRGQDSSTSPCFRGGRSKHIVPPPR